MQDVNKPASPVGLVGGSAFACPLRSVPWVRSLTECVLVRKEFFLHEKNILVSQRKAREREVATFDEDRRASGGKAEPCAR